jgi:uncharacterized membrane protein YuzA (DUF378 family)
MNIQEHTTPKMLEWYSFLWSEARLLVAAVALFIGGTPPVLALNPLPALYGLISSLLTIAWVISGLAAAYLLYRWFTGGQKIFGEKVQLDSGAFFVLVVSGFNLGFAGLMGSNIGMSISTNQAIFYLVGILYIAAAVHLYRRWSANGQKLF